VLVDAVGVADESVEQRTHLQQLTPVAAGRRQRGDLDTERQAT
jgi:hypothetical protein